MYRYLAAASLALVTIAPAHADSLDLTCMGGGTGNHTRTHVAQFGNSNGDTAWGTSQSREAVGFSDQADFHMADGIATIRMPRSMLPRIHGGDDGWMKVKNLEVADRTITGTIALNPMNGPKLRIDRLTGVLSIHGKAGDYTGDCRAYDPNTAQRRF
jgi:hypothetical protein